MLSRCDGRMSCRSSSPREAILTVEEDMLLWYHGTGFIHLVLYAIGDRVVMVLIVSGWRRPMQHQLRKSSSGTTDPLFLPDLYML